MHVRGWFSERFYIARCKCKRTCSLDTLMKLIHCRCMESPDMDPLETREGTRTIELRVKKVGFYYLEALMIPFSDVCLHCNCCINKFGFL